MTPAMRFLISLPLLFILAGCAGAYVGGDVGDHHSNLSNGGASSAQGTSRQTDR